MNIFKKSTILGADVGPKSFFIAFLILVLLIPSAWVRELIDERSDTSESAAWEISDKWGAPQTVQGPVLNIPVTIQSGETQYNDLAHFLPESLYISGELIPEVRTRGIYEVPLYTADLNIDGTFTKPDFSDLGEDVVGVNWDAAYLTLGVSDMRGITEEITLNWNDIWDSFEPGLSNSDLFANGVRQDVQVWEEVESYAFNMELSLNGSDNIYFSPLGKETVVDLSSSWLNPSFSGAFLPDSHEITEEGFGAYWKVIDLNRNFPQQWLSGDASISGYDYGVHFFQPVDIYQKTDRSAKYMILFIALTFAVFFFIEVINEKRFHPIQYLLVGIALIIFYLLLLSLAEHIGFDLAYLAGSIGTVGLITLYGRSLFNSGKLTGVLFGLLTLLYIFLYILLQLVDYSLLMGSLGLFIIIAAIMYTTRNIDWYGGEQKKS